MALVKLQTEPIDVAFYYNQLKDPRYGGIVTFAGVIREWTGAIQTKGIGYTAYEEMAEKELLNLATKVEAKGAKVVLVHRLGELKIGEEAVFIGVSCPHRKDAFVGCEYLIDHLKRNVPIWKKEYDTDKVRWGGLSQ